MTHKRIASADLIRSRPNPPGRADYCALLRKGFLLLVVLGLIAQVVYDRHLITAISLFPQWLLLASIWYLWRQEDVASHGRASGTAVLAVLIPTLACLSLLVAWLGWKANVWAACGVVPISDARMYYVSAQTLLREGVLDVAGQRRPLNIVVTALWLYLSGDHFKGLLVLQTMAFSAAVFLASWLVAVLHGFRAGLLLFAFLLVFAEPYLPSTMSETNGITFGVLALAGILFGLHRRSLFAYCLGAVLLALGLAIRPSAIFVLASVVIAGAMIFGNASRSRRLLVIAVLSILVLIPSGVSVLLNKAWSRHDGAFNANLAYTIYGLVSGGRGWEQYQKDHPQALAGLPEATQSAVVLEAAKQHFRQHPFDLVLGLAKGQLLGPVKTLSQITRLAFLGTDGDPLRVITPAIGAIMLMGFVAVLGCQMTVRKRKAINADVRLFGLWFLFGYLLSIPFFYEDGGLRLHAAVLPAIAYMLVWVLLPPAAASEGALASSSARGFSLASKVLGCAFLALLGWILILPRSGNFAPIPRLTSAGANTSVFWFKPGWPECNLRDFEATAADHRPLWFSGVIPDYNDRAALIREIAGRGKLYLGLDASARDWKAIHTETTIGLVNEVQFDAWTGAGGREASYRDFYEAGSIQVVDAKGPR